jgi:hypothetical protein
MQTLNPAAILVSLKPGSKDGPREPHQIQNAEMGRGIGDQLWTFERVSQVGLRGCCPLEQSHPCSVG